jgi:hypothetical protein
MNAIHRRLGTTLLLVMRKTKAKGAVALLGAFVLVGVSAGSASAQTIFESGVEGIRVAAQTIAGIAGGAPWDVGAGEARIRGNGDLKVEVEGLVLTTPILPADPVFPVLGVCGSLVCQKTGADTPTNEQVAVTGSFPLSPVTGDAEVDATVTLPAVCVAPIVLLRVSAVDSGFFAPECMGGAGTCTATGVAVPIGCNGPWIAASGF